jgi:hypothetical protein
MSVIWTDDEPEGSTKLDTFEVVGMIFVAFLVAVFIGVLCWALYEIRVS